MYGMAKSGISLSSCMAARPQVTDIWDTPRPPDLLASLPTTGLAHVHCGAAPLQKVYMESPTPTTATAFEGASTARTSLLSPPPLSDEWLLVAMCYSQVADKV